MPGKPGWGIFSREFSEIGVEHKLFHVEQFWPRAMFAVLSNLFVENALFSVTSICVGLRVFVYWLAGENPDSQMEVRIPGFPAACFRESGFVRVMLIGRFVI